eukprot:TRINITY_DN4241_c0_g2_i2.p1 TRINITY_DN4241_c0_g2~~TRINITY_DN4241_c0_g2_i2.p1  ORF type:complete len:897 (+),score=205.78 TRINITY_DN4241_c0_g2_i2:527-3217(+)
MKADFVFGFIQAIDGEKDPRNLVIVFRLVRIIVQSIPEFIRFDEDLFEVTSCYFPITFNQKPNDPEAITKEDLVLSLRNCLAATPAFAPYSMPFLLDKLTSDVVDTKLDTLQTISACLRGYGAAALIPFVEDLWAALRQEIMTGNSGAVIEASFETLKTTIQVLDTVPAPTSYKADDSQSKEYLQRFLTPCLNQCLHQLQNFDSKLSLLASRVLQTATATSYSACKQIIEVVLPVMMEQFFAADSSSSKRQILLKILIGYIHAINEYASTHDHRQDLETEPHPISKFKDKLFEILLSSVVVSPNLSKEEKSEAILGLGDLASLSSGRMLDRAQIESIVSHLSNLLSSTGLDHVETSATTLTLIVIAKFHMEIIINIAIPKLFSVVSSSGGDVVVQQTMRTLTVLATCGPSLFSNVVERILGLIESSLLYPKFVSNLIESIGSCLVSHANHNASTSTTGLSSKVPKWELSSEFLEVLLMRLQKLSILSYESPSYEKIIEDLPSITSYGMNQLPPARQSHLLGLIYQLYVYGDISIVQIHSLPIKFLPFDEKSPVYFRRLTSLFASFVGTVNKSVNLIDTMLPTLDVLFNSLLSFDSHGNRVIPFTDKEQVTICSAVAGIVNKINNEDLLQEFLSKKVDNGILSSVHDVKYSIPHRKSMAQLLIWIIKGLITRGHKDGNRLWKSLMDNILIEDSSNAMVISHYVAASMEIIFEDHSTLQNVKPLYKQKFFVINLPIMLEQFRQTNSKREAIYLVAISNMLKHLPTSILLSELHQILPILLQATKLPITPDGDNSIHLASVGTFMMLSQEAPQTVCDHLGTLVPRLLDMSSNPHSPVDVRKLSLQCLSVFTKFQFHQLHPFQGRVLRELKPALDDKKRDVRKLASKARNEWFVIGFSTS